MGNESHMLSRLDEDGPGTKTKKPKATRLCLMSYRISKSRGIKKNPICKRRQKRANVKTKNINGIGL
jgi:hypothetical protein